jgi:hypothetical protein
MRYCAVIAASLLNAVLFWSSPFPAAAATAPPTAAEKAALAAMLTYENAQGTTDIESPACHVISDWAMCSFGTGQGNAEVNAFLHQKGGAWKGVLSGGGVFSPSQLETQTGMPAAIAKQFSAAL